MRIPLIAIALSVAFAGCSDPLPSGDLASTGHALAVTGAITGFDAQEFAAAAPDPVSGQQPCPVDSVPPQDGDPLAGQRCQRPYTTFTVNFTALPDPLSQSYALKFVSGDGAMADITTVSGHVHPTTGAYMADEYTFDNTDDCDEETSNDGCYLADTYDGIQLWLGEIHVASAPMGNGAFELAPGLLGATFSVTFEGKDLVLTATGLGNYTYEGWLIYTEEDGTVKHDQSFPVANGENTFAAPMNIEEYSGVHIHVAGTKLNVAVGALA